MSLYSKLHGGPQGSDRELSKKQFFITESNVNGYMKPKEIMDYLTSQSEWAVDNLVVTFDYLKEGVKMTTLPTVKTDRNGNPYLWLGFQLAKVNPGLKVPSHPGIVAFIKDYQYGKIEPTFTMEELVQEADEMLK